MVAIDCGFSFIMISSECDRGGTLFLQFSSAPSNTSNQKIVNVPLGDLLVFTVRLSKIRIKTV